MSTALKVNATAKLSKANENGEVPIYLRLTHNKKRTEVSTQRWVLGKNWNQSLKRATGSGSTKINNFLDEEIADIRSFARKLDLQGEAYDVHDIRNLYLGGGKKDEYFLLERFKAHIGYMQRLEGISYKKRTISHYEVTYNHLEKFIFDTTDKTDVNLDDVNHKFITDFDIYLRSSKNHNHNTAVRHKKRLKTVIRICLADSLITKDPFARIKLGYVSSDREALTQDELKRLMEAKFDVPKLEIVRDVFVFCCFTGLSYIDVKGLKPTNILQLNEKDQIVKGKREKTGQDYSALLLEPALRILKKYKSHPKCVQQEILLPVMSNQKMNDYLKVIGMKLEIAKPLSCHIARYTFITTVATANGLSSQIIAGAVGHSNTHMTDSYTVLKDVEIAKQMKSLDNPIQSLPPIPMNVGH